MKDNEEIYEYIKSFVDEANDLLPIPAVGIAQIEITRKTHIENDITVAVAVNGFNVVINHMKEKDMFAIVIMNSGLELIDQMVLRKLDDLLKYMLIKTINYEELTDEIAYPLFEFLGIFQDMWDKLERVDFDMEQTPWEWNKEEKSYDRLDSLIKYYELNEEFERCSKLKEINVKPKKKKKVKKEKVIVPKKTAWDKEWKASYDAEEDMWKIKGRESQRVGEIEIFFEDRTLLEEYIEEFNLKVKFL